MKCLSEGIKRKYIGRTETDILLDYPLRYINQDFIKVRLKDEYEFIDCSGRCENISDLVNGDREAYLSFSIVSKLYKNEFRHYEYDRKNGLGFMIYRVGSDHDPVILMIEDGYGKGYPGILNCSMTHSIRDLESLENSLKELRRWIKNNEDLLVRSKDEILNPNFKPALVTNVAKIYCHLRDY